MDIKQRRHQNYKHLGLIKKKSWFSDTAALKIPPDETFLSWEGKTRAPRGTDRSPEYNEHFCYKLDSRVKN